MIRFESDYTQGAVPEIIERLAATNMEMTPGYGEDEYCMSAREKIRKEINLPDADVHFLVGGTQTNLTFIASAIKPYQCVLCADTGHINVHETGAIEACGHKIIGLPSPDGKITAEQVAFFTEHHYADPTFEHMPQPGMVYISFPTECGTLYSKAELTALSGVCRERGLTLYMDGARLGYALACKENDLTMADIAKLCDAFYIGGTKVGALFGEALVVTKESCKKDFRYMMKQRGAMLAKGRLLGLQFDTLFTDGLYYRISENAASLAEKIRSAFRNKGIEFFFDSPTNQQFPMLTKEQYDTLAKEFVFCDWGVTDGKYIVRFCTSWATDEKDVDKLVEAIETI